MYFIILCYILSSRVANYSTREMGVVLVEKAVRKLVWVKASLARLKALLEPAALVIAFSWRVPLAVHA
jgi:hypothetical protein